MRDPRPVVISILTINQARLLEDCLASLFAHPPRVPFRVHVFDQASTDDTPRVLARFRERYPDLVDVHRHPENIGFVRANNIVFRKYPDHDVVVLNDDTVLLPGWLDALRARIESDPTIGVVGARLVYPNGVLQEAGGEVFRDATGQNIGKWDDPARPEYLRVADVDYCSGACLYIRREVLDATGGFDERFAPAYYEDSDLCFAARRLGWRVVYEPASVIVHREGATNGVDLRQGVKRWQAVNRERFLEKWGDVLASHRRGIWHNPPPPGGRSILFIHEMPPLFDQAAGDTRLFELMRGLARRSHAVTLLAVDARGEKGYYADRLRAEGVMVAPNDWPRWPLFGLGGDPPPRSCTAEQLFHENDFDLVVIEFYRVARVYLPLVRKLAPGVPVVTDSVDVHYVREQREARVQEDPWMELVAARTREVELSLYEMSDAVLTVTEDDSRALTGDGLETPVRVTSHPVHVADRVPPREGREGLFFIGNFRHRPNPDAVAWFAREIWPRVRTRRPDAVFRVAGSAIPPEIRELEGDGIEVLGFVPDRDEMFDRSLVSVAPLRFGAGIKGKVLEAMARGLPVVTTSVGIEGMDATPGEHLLVADDPGEFAEEVVRLLDDAALWECVSRQGREFVANRWGVAAILDQAERLLAEPPAVRAFPARTRLELDLARPAEPCPTVPGVLGVVMSATDPREAGLALERLRELHGGDVDAIVLFDGRDREEWIEHALLGRYRLAVPTGTELAPVLAATAPHLAAERVLYVDCRLAVFRHTLERLEAALAADPGGAVHGTAIPAAPDASGNEPWELAAARARQAGEGDPAEVLLFRRDALLAGIEEATSVPGATVVDPARPPEIRVEQPRDPGRTLVAVLGADETARANWSHAEPGTEVTFLDRADADLGGRLGELVGGSRAGQLLVVDGRCRPVRPFLPEITRVLQDTGGRLATIYAVPAEQRIPWPGDFFTGTRLAWDVPGMPGLLYMTLPALLFREPRPEFFETGTGAAAALWRAWQLGAYGQPMPVLHDGRRFYLECDRWPGGDEIREQARRAGTELADVVRRSDLVPAGSMMDAGAPWWFAPARVAELIDEMIEANRSMGPRASDVTWEQGSFGSLLLWARIQLDLAHLFREVLEGRRRPETLARWRDKSPLATVAWQREALAETLAAARHVLAAAGRREEARAYLAEARELAPANPVVLAISAEEALAAGRAEEALPILARLRERLARDPGRGLWPRGHVTVRALLLEAVLLAREGRDRELVAVTDFLEERHLRPGGAAGRKLLELRAGALERLGRGEEAHLARVTAIALAPGVTDRPVPGAAQPGGAGAPERTRPVTVETWGPRSWGPLRHAAPRGSSPGARPVEEQRGRGRHCPDGGRNRYSAGEGPAGAVRARREG